MLQYPVQLPPLSLKSQKLSAQDNDYFRNNDLQSLNRRRIHKDSPSSNLVNRLSISTNLSPSTSDSSPSTTSAKLPRSPYISSRPLPSPVPFVVSPKSNSSSIASQTLHDVLAPGDIVGEGFYLQGEVVRQVFNGQANERPAEFEVIKQLGTGSYAVVYLVREVLSRPPISEDGHMSTIGIMEFDNRSTSTTKTQYGKEYAIKCLSKANLDEDALAIQMSEVTIHQSLRLHPNIVALHRTLETSAFLLLLLEYVPGEDLFYFLEQSRDHYDLDTAQPTTDSSVSTSHTPPTPSLLSNLHPSQLLSRTRLRLIASMFAQMCDAVAACHAQQVFHRDIKPENFIVTDGKGTTSDGRLERKVVVKLTDFGLSTTDIESADMDCGSAPYMSYECRNNVAPTYRPRAADVWSLGIVLINMLYHFNPWTDTAVGACASFDMYRRDPINFFMQRFTGMTRPVAEVLATKVFCILEDPHDDSPRMGAAEFGAWAKNLPTLLGGHGVHRTVSNSSTQGHRISLSIPMSHRPCSRHPSHSTTAARSTPLMQTRSLSRAPSLEPPLFEREELSTVIDQDNEDDMDDQDEQEGMESRSTSTTKRRKRGARKGKGLITAASPMATQDTTLETLAVDAQSLAREISMASKAPSKSNSIAPSGRSVSSKRARVAYEPVSMYAMPHALLSSRSATSRSTATSAKEAIPPVPPVPAVPSLPVAPPKPVTKKPSKWKLSFGKNSGASAAAAAASASAGRISPVDELAPPTVVDLAPPPLTAHMSTTASNVTSLLMGLDAPLPPHTAPANRSSPLHPFDDPTSTWSRGRRGARDALPHQSTSPLLASSMRQPPIHNNSYQNQHQRPSRSPGYALSSSPHPPPLPAQDHWGNDLHAHTQAARQRAVSPNNSTRSTRQPTIGSSASSVVSSNWRSSMSTSSSASTSAFTRYSNSSARSVATTATSVSSASWRTSVKPSSTFAPATSPTTTNGSSSPGSSSTTSTPTAGNTHSYAKGNIPKNIKIMDGVPWELGQLPRGQHPSPVGDIFGSPPIRKQRTRKPPKDLKLDTITERPNGAGAFGLGPMSNSNSNLTSPKSPLSAAASPSPDYLRRDASTSTTDLGALDADGMKKVKKDQINTLAKMLSALRR